jgi:large subunit ribosomal protein L10e
VIRRHALAGVHKAERLQKGMRLAFGKPDGRAARIMKGQEIMVLRVRAQDLELAKEAIRIGKLKLPHMTKVVVERIAGNEKKGA